ncbi:MAG: diguanylate cyclase [bacterium]|nr:diguanylate cyclase [bacterium]
MESGCYVDLEDNSALILLVDDIPDNIQVLHQILRSQGYSFAIATNWNETYHLVNNQIPDLILLDIMLPGIDGFEICKRLKQNEKTVDVPIIFLTAKTELEDKIKAFELGAVDYVTKPFNDIEVIARVRTHIQLRKSQKALLKCNDKLEDEKRMLQTMAITDWLTKIYNRMYIFERLNEEITKTRRYSRTFAVIMVDIDHFKVINDTYGHQVGDMVLITVSDTIKANLREYDLLGRYGGEEFLCILPETTIENAAHIAERIRKEISHLEWGSDTMTVTISAGLTEYRSGEKDFELIKRVDDLLYTAKENGRNRIER